MSKVKYGVYIGRFHPFHTGHMHVVTEAKKHCENLIVVVGSANVSRSPKNPFPANWRTSMVDNALMEAGWNRNHFTVTTADDDWYNDTVWTKNIRDAVHEAVTHMLERGNGFIDPDIDLEAEFNQIAIVGCAKDKATEAYIKMFPEWIPPILVDPKPNGNGKPIDATYLRDNFYETGVWDEKFVPESVLKILSYMQEMNPDHFKWLKREYEFYRDYKKAWESAPYPPTIHCVDNLVVQSGHILLIQRGKDSGIGQWALPGGHIEQLETFKDAAIRELREETLVSDHKGKIPAKILESFIDERATWTNDYPGRSLRGRVITTVFKYDLPDTGKLFHVKGDDDAAFAKWVHVSDIHKLEFYDDHYFMIKKMLNI
ncbi:bifunctional NMN adenylyltransferase/nudix hydrolase [Ochrobactrum phage vB_OspM_OC]|nr:bifunctional NMN adenylyltransferase/nudix hydrolase [Ochrobactrum phage vB_OspM_OC]